MAGLSKDDAQEIAEKAVIAAFVRMGIDTDKPIEVQKDMAFLRQNRERCEKAINKLVATAVLGIFAIGSGMQISTIIEKLKP